MQNFGHKIIPCKKAATGLFSALFYIQNTKSEQNFGRGVVGQAAWAIVQRVWHWGLTWSQLPHAPPANRAQLRWQGTSFLRNLDFWNFGHQNFQCASMRTNSTHFWQLGLNPNVLVARLCDLVIPCRDRENCSLSSTFWYSLRGQREVTTVLCLPICFPGVFRLCFIFSWWDRKFDTCCESKEERVRVHEACSLWEGMTVGLERPLRLG